jgi:hypothetical protein
METASALDVTVKLVDRVAPPKAADTMTEPDVQAEADTVKVPLMFPDGTSTVGGTVAIPGSLLVRATAAPPAGAGALRMAVPVDAAPLVTLVGARFKEERLVAGDGVTRS